MDNSDIEQFLRKSLNILFIKNPAGTALGFALGISLSAIFNFFVPVLKSYLSSVISWESLNKVFWISISVFGFNIKPYIERGNIDEEIINALDFIAHQQERGLITKEQAKFQYQRLQNQVVSNVVLNEKEREKARRINEEFTNSGDE